MITRRLCIFDVLACFVLLVFATPAQANGSNSCQECPDPAQPSGGANNCCPRVWVEVTPAYFPQSPADHTYIQFMKDSGQCQSWPCFGADSGGDKLNDTQSSTWEENVDLVAFLSDQSPCKWPKHFYLIVGVCHQLANRGLIHTGKTVHNARMYGWSSFIYHTYGKCFWPLNEYCMDNCLDKASALDPWKDGSSPSCMQTVSSSMKQEAPNEEVQLYLEYYSRTSKTKVMEERRELATAYRRDLLSLHVRQRLGDEVHKEKFPAIMELQSEVLSDKEKLDTILLERKKLDKEIIEQYNELFNRNLEKFRKTLTPEEYEKFFGMPFDEKLDVTVFMPQERER